MRGVGNPALHRGHDAGGRGAEHSGEFRTPWSTLQKRAFLDALQAAGLSLEEQPVIPHSALNDPKFTWQHYTEQHNRQNKLDEDA